MLSSILAPSATTLLLLPVNALASCRAVRDLPHFGAQYPLKTNNLFTTFVALPPSSPQQAVTVRPALPLTRRALRHWVWLLSPPTTCISPHTLLLRWISTHLDLARRTVHPGKPIYFARFPLLTSQEVDILTSCATDLQRLLRVTCKLSALSGNTPPARYQPHFTILYRVYTPCCRLVPYFPLACIQSLQHSTNMNRIAPTIFPFRLVRVLLVATPARACCINSALY